MKYNIYIAILLILGLSSISFADDNGVWHLAKDIKPGIFGSDEGASPSNSFTFLNKVNLNEDVLYKGVELNNLYVNSGEIDSISISMLDSTVNSAYVNIGEVNSVSRSMLDGTVDYEYININEANSIGYSMLKSDVLSNLNNIYVQEGEIGAITSNMISSDFITELNNKYVLKRDSVGSTDVDSTEVQERVYGTCGAGEYMTGISQDGSVTCVELPGAESSYVEHSYFDCSTDDDSYWFDSLGIMNDKKEECNAGVTEGEYEIWYCESPTTRRRDRQVYTNGCSGGSCTSSTITDSETETCDDFCSGGTCFERPSNIMFDDVKEIYTGHTSIYESGKKSCIDVDIDCSSLLSSNFCTIKWNKIGATGVYINSPDVNIYKGETKISDSWYFYYDGGSGTFSLPPTDNYLSCEVKWDADDNNLKIQGVWERVGTLGSIYYYGKISTEYSTYVANWYTLP